MYSNHAQELFQGFKPFVSVHDMTLPKFVLYIFKIINVHLLVITHVTQLVHGYSYGLPFSTHHTTPFLYGKMYIVGSCRVFIPESHDYQIFADMTMQIAPAH